MQLVRDKRVVQQKVARVVTIGLNIHRRSVFKGVPLSLQMNSCDQAPELFHQLRVVELRCTPAATRRHGKAKRAAAMQGCAVDLERCDNRDVCVR